MNRKDFGGLMSFRGEFGRIVARFVRYHWFLLILHPKNIEFISDTLCVSKPDRSRDVRLLRVMGTGTLVHFLRVMGTGTLVHSLGSMNLSPMILSYISFGNVNRYSGAKSAPFSHSTVLYFTENFLKKSKSFRGSNTIPLSDDFKSTTFVTLLLNHNLMR